MLSKYLAVFGLSIDIVGVWLVAYELIWRPVHNLEKERFVYWLQIQHSWLAKVGSQLQRGSLNRADEADGGAFLRESLERTKARIDELNREEKDLEHRFYFAVYRWGVLGLLLITIGFILQLCSYFV